MGDLHADNDTGLPWQVRALAVIGFPAAAAAFLLWMMAGVLSEGAKALPRIEQKIDAHMESTKSILSDMATEARLLNDHRMRLEAYLRLVCVNSATSPQERANCLSVR